LQRPRLEPHELLELGRTVAATLTHPALPIVQRRGPTVLPLVLLGALLVGALGTIVAVRAGSHARPPMPTAPVVAPVAVPVVAPVAVPVVAPVPVPVVAPIAPAAGATVLPPTVAPVTPPTQPSAPAATDGPCPLGMVALAGSHPYCIDLYEYPGGHTIPRTQVSFADAGQICAGRGLRLCTDPEWEQACRGPSQASYPYGTSFDPQRCNTASKGTVGSVQPAGALARCRSAAGAYDMSGNVAEWSASGARRGGSVFTPAPSGRCSHAVRSADTSAAVDVGFRCCGDTR